MRHARSHPCSRALLATVLLLTPAGALASSGGPDSYGYTWIDSNEAGGPVYDSSFVTQIGAPSLCDSEWTTADLGFDFEFYGVMYAKVWVSANGNLYPANYDYFQITNADENNLCPMQPDTYGRISPFWHDFVANDDDVGSSCNGDTGTYTPIVGWETTGVAPDRIFRITWLNNTSDICPTGNGVTFTVSLHEGTNWIEFHYQDTSFSSSTCDSGAYSTVGLADYADATANTLTAACNTASSIPSNYAIRFLPPCWDADGDGWDTDVCGGMDCDDSDPTISPVGTETCDGTDEDCDTLVDEGFDTDGDGALTCTSPVDCWEGDPAASPSPSDTYPGAPETADGVDNDCDGTVDEGTVNADDDGDGFSENGGDCDDTDADLSPGQSEVADGIDNNCNGTVDEGSSGVDDDGDGYTEEGGDCDDSNASIHPGATETANGMDEDCDGEVDEGLGEVDADGDGWTVSGGDCDDSEAEDHPGAVELANGEDDDCDGIVDEDTETSDDDGDTYAEVEGDCVDRNPEIHPGAEEVSNGIDDNCDGQIDEGTVQADDDGDGFAEGGGDCDDSNASVHPGAVEFPDGIDQDCDGAIDEGTEAWDGDLDGYSVLNGDCDDNDPWARPGGEELCDEVDNDCDQAIDEDCDEEEGSQASPPPGCGLAASAGSGAPGLLLLLTSLLAGRRRRARQQPGGDRRRRGLAPALSSAVAIAVFGSGCGSDVAVHAGLGDLVITPSPLDLGAILVGEAVTGEVRLDNAGTATLNIASLSIQDDDIDVFGVEAESALSLGRGEGAIATITYEPNLVGLHSASLVIVSDSAGSTSAEAAIRGQAGLPSAGIAPRVLDFGLLSGSLPVSIAPTTAFPLTVEGLELSGAIDDFSTSMATTFGELPLTLSAGQQLSVQVLFHPTVEIPVEATLWILTNDPNASEVGVALIGNSSCDGGTALLEDIDGDGFSPCADDCDDHDASIYPGAPELADGLDNNCNDLIDEGTNAADDDGDTYSEDEGDCHDGDPEISPDATETANGVDDDCDGTVDEDTAASDDDGDGFTEEGGDCDDTDPEIAPGQTDIEDGIDNDCDGIIDNGTSAGDDDGDGFSEAQGDCHDGNANVYPGANESPNGVDDDCDGTVDEGTVNVDDDGDGFTESGGDCDDTEDTAHPGGTEVAGNGIDEDCDGFMD